MKTVNFSIEEKQVEQLKNHYSKTGIRMSEIVRRAIDLYFIKIEENRKRDEKSNDDI